MTSATAPASADRDPGELSHRQILTILSGLLLGMFLAALDQTVVSTAIKTIGTDLHDLTAQAWVTTAFLITSTMAAPVFGKLSDIYGRKRLFMVAIVIFVAGSALCGLAQSMYELAGFRAFQGIGAGGIMPLALAIIGDIIPPRERARYQGYMMATFASSSVLGPVLGGIFAGQATLLGVSGWRWIFYINVPVAAAALFVIARVLESDRGHGGKRRIDWYGSLTLALGLVPLLVIAEQGQVWGWASTRSLLCCVVGVGGVLAFVWTERRMGDDALLPLSLFRNRTFTVASLQVTVLGAAMFGGVAVLPLYLQIVKGASPTKAGLLMLPLLGGLMATSLAVGRVISRTGRYKVFPVAGSGFMLVGMGLLSRIAADTPLWQTDAFMLTFGIGLGLSMQPLVLAMQNSVAVNHLGVASSSSSFFRSIGGTLGTAVFLSMLFGVAGNKINGAYDKAQRDGSFASAAKAHPDQLALVRQHLAGTAGLNDTSFLATLTAPLRHPYFVGFANAADFVFVACTILLTASVVLSLSLKEVPLRLVSGNQARAQDEAARSRLADSML